MGPQQSPLQPTYLGRFVPQTLATGSLAVWFQAAAWPQHSAVCGWSRHNWAATGQVHWSDCPYKDLWKMITSQYIIRVLLLRNSVATTALEGVEWVCDGGGGSGTYHCMLQCSRHFTILLRTFCCSPWCIVDSIKYRQLSNTPVTATCNQFHILIPAPRIL